MPSAFPLPAPGDIVYCRFPETLGKPGPKRRPALVTGLAEFEDSTRGVVVAYGTSRRVAQLVAGEFAVTPADGEAFEISGLSYPTKFDLARSVTLPYTDEWFRVPPIPPFGQTPKLGVLHPSLMRRAQAAYLAARPRTRK